MSRTGQHIPEAARANATPVFSATAIISRPWSSA